MPPGGTAADFLGEEKFNAMLERFPSLRIAVAGDLFLDKWLEVDKSLDELSVETGLTAHQVVRKRCYAGVVGTILSNLSAMDIGTLYAVSFTGDDGEGYEIRRILNNLRVNTGHVTVSGKVMTPTYTKPLFFEKAGKGGGVESNRLDHKNVNPTPTEIEDAMIASLRSLAGKVDAIIASDQLTAEGYGALTPRVREALAQIAAENPGLPVYADSRAFISRFKNMIIKCNDREAALIVTGKKIPLEEKADLSLAADCLAELSKQNKRDVFVTCGERGILVKDQQAGSVLVPAIPVPPPIDIVGAGDACNAGIVSALCCGASPAEAAVMGNLAASITIKEIGTTGTASRAQLRESYRRIQK
jgi:bifunctional ADP-heptose synthase (sugar kinase/adenylyltransferase)